MLITIKTCLIALLFTNAFFKADTTFSLADLPMKNFNLDDFSEKRYKVLSLLSRDFSTLSIKEKGLKYEFTQKKDPIDKKMQAIYASKKLNKHSPYDCDKVLEELMDLLDQYEQIYNERILNVKNPISIKNVKVTKNMRQ